MSSLESTDPVLRHDQDPMATTREWLGKPVFPDKKRGNKIAVLVFSGWINEIFQNRGEILRDEAHRVVEDCRKEEISITPASVTLNICLRVSTDMRRKLLLDLTQPKSEDRPILIAGLDVIKGFQHVLSVVSRVYVSSSENTKSNEMDDTAEAARRIRLRSKDPKGFDLVKAAVKFWRNSPLAIRDMLLVKDYEDQELVIAGVELGAKTYKRMYPIVEKVLSSRS